MGVDEPGGDFYTALLDGVVEEGHAFEADEMLGGAVVGVKEVLQVCNVVFGEGAEGEEHVHVVGDEAGGLVTVLANRGCGFCWGCLSWRRRLWGGGGEEEDDVGAGLARVKFRLFLLKLVLNIRVRRAQGRVQFARAGRHSTRTGDCRGQGRGSF